MLAAATATLAPAAATVAASVSLIWLQTVTAVTMVVSPLYSDSNRSFLIEIVSFRSHTMLPSTFSSSFPFPLSLFRMFFIEVIFILCTSKMALHVLYVASLKTCNTTINSLLYHANPGWFCVVCQCAHPIKRSCISSL